MKILDISDEAGPVEIDSRPEFESVIDGFRAWLELQESELDQLFTTDCPALLDLGFSQEGLAAAAEFLLMRVPDRNAAVRGSGSEALSRVSRFWGEYLLRNVGGEWVLVYDAANTPALSTEPRVLPAYGAPIFNPFRDALACVLRRSDGLSRMAEYAASDYQNWIASGRPQPLGTP